MINPFKKLEVNRFVLRHPRIDPAHDGARVAQVTDVHYGPWVRTKHLDAVVNFVNDDGPDLTVLTGDYIGYNPKTMAPCANALARLTGPRYAVLGNHDHWAGTELCVHSKSAWSGVHCPARPSQQETAKASSHTYPFGHVQHGLDFWSGHRLVHDRHPQRHTLCTA